MLRADTAAAVLYHALRPLGTAPASIQRHPKYSPITSLRSCTLAQAAGQASCWKYTTPLVQL